MRGRIVLVIFVVTFVLTESFSAFFYRNMMQDLEHDLNQYANSLAFQFSQYFNERQHSFITSVYSMSISSRFRTALREYLHSDYRYQYSMTLTEFNAIISDVKLNHPFLWSTFLYTPKDTFYDLSSVFHEKNDFLLSDLYSRYAADGMPAVWYGSQQADDVFRSNSRVVPLILRCSVPGCAEVCYLVIYLNATALQHTLTQGTIPGIDTLIVNDRGELIASSDHLSAEPEKYLALLNQADGAGSEEYIISENKMKNAPWSVVCFASRSVIGEQLSRYQLYMRLAHIVVLLAALGLSLLFAGSIVKPLKDLQLQMEQFGGGDYSVRSEYTQNNEVGQLAMGFNAMANHIGQLISQLSCTIHQLELEKENVRIEQARKQEAELQALQAQIDPHFLYNTLNSIIWLASEEKSSEVVDLAAALSEFYKYRIQGAGNMVTVEQELEEVRQYLLIQQIRYKDKFSCDFSVPAAYLSCTVPRLSIQPLVENAIFHGLCCQGSQGRIVIRACRPDGAPGDWTLEVEDDGAGMAPETLAQVNATLARGDIPEEGYGIYNVNQRIRMCFGDAYGLSYDSESGAYTRAILRLPYTAKEEETEPCILS